MQWIVIANRECAKIYNYTNDFKFKLLKQLPNPLGRLKSQKMEYDQPGKSFAKYIKSAPHSLSKELTPHEQAANQFAKELCDLLDSSLKKDTELKLKIICESKLIGKIRSRLNKKIYKDKIEWINKDLANIPQYQWAELLNLKLPPTPPEISNRFPL